MNAVIVIPIYNHATRIAAVVEAAHKTGLPIIVVNDGSTDTTAEVLTTLAEQTDVQVLQHDVNQGKGAALLTGFAAAAERGFSWAVALDADGQHLPEDCRNLLDAVPQEGDNADSPKQRCIVIGARRDMHSNANVPWSSRFGRGFSNFWVWASGGPLVGDSQSGFRLYPLPETLQLNVVARRYQYEVEVLVRARRADIPIYETGVQVVYQPKGERISHFLPWTDFKRNSATFSRLIFARIFGRL